MKAEEPVTEERVSIIKSHCSVDDFNCHYPGGKVIVVVRDGRDLLLCYYFYHNPFLLNPVEVHYYSEHRIMVGGVNNKLRAFLQLSPRVFRFGVHDSFNFLVTDYYHSNPVDFIFMEGVSFNHHSDPTRNVLDVREWYGARDWLSCFEDIYNSLSMNGVWVNRMAFGLNPERSKRLQTSVEHFFGDSVIFTSCFFITFFSTPTYTLTFKKRR
jgi:hypothetical protein